MVAKGCPEGTEFVVPKATPRSVTDYLVTNPHSSVESGPHIEENRLETTDDIRQQSTTDADICVRLPSQQSSLDLPSPWIVLLGDSMSGSQPWPAMPYGGLLVFIVGVGYGPQVGGAVHNRGIIRRPRRLLAGR